MKRIFAILAALLLLPHLVFAEASLTVVRIIDGDTVQLSNGEKVRLIGVDASESKNDAKLLREGKRTGEAAQAIVAEAMKVQEFAGKRVEGRRVRLEYDLLQKDDSGKTLAYVYVMTEHPRTAYVHWVEGIYSVREKESHEIFLNATLIRSGFAKAVSTPPNVKQTDLFLRLQKEARDKKRGVWK